MEWTQMKLTSSKGKLALQWNVNAYCRSSSSPIQYDKAWIVHSQWYWAGLISWIHEAGKGMESGYLSCLVEMSNITNLSDDVQMNLPAGFRRQCWFCNQMRACRYNHALQLAVNLNWINVNQEALRLHSNPWSLDVLTQQSIFKSYSSAYYSIEWIAYK